MRTRVGRLRTHFYKISQCAVIPALWRHRQEDSGLPDGPTLSCMCGEPKATRKCNRRLENHTGDKGLQLASQLTLGIPKHSKCEPWKGLNVLMGSDTYRRLFSDGCTPSMREAFKLQGLEKGDGSVGNVPAVQVREHEFRSPGPT